MLQDGSPSLIYIKDKEKNHVKEENKPHEDKPHVKDEEKSKVKVLCKLTNTGRWKMNSSRI